MNSIVYNTDCIQGLINYPDNYFDWAICDIPYGINVGNMAFLKETKTTVKQRNGKRINPNRKKKTYTSKNWDLTPPSQTYYDELQRVSKNQIIFGIEYVDWEGVGTGRIKWNKGVPKGVSFKSYELAYCSSITHTEEINLLWSGMMQAKSLTNPMVQQGNKKLNEKRLHPCHKPRLLYRKLLQDYVPKGSKVLDTHLGAGSTRIECDLANCSFVGYELDFEYFKLQENRYNEFKQQLRLF